MKQFNHIEIHKENATLMKLVEKMKALKNEDFFYDKEASDRTNDGCKNDPVCGGTYYALFTTKQESLYLATVFVSVKDDELKVFNITSSDPRYFILGIERYNYVINHFFHHFMARCLDMSFTGSITVSGEELSVENLIGKEAYEALVKWEKTCNKDNPLAHPMDERMWFAFLKALHDNEKIFHPDDFSQWLSDDCHWSSYYNNVIAKLAETLEYSLSLLNYYDSVDNP
jgi:hypothetical protein